MTEAMAKELEKLREGPGHDERKLADKLEKMAKRLAAGRKAVR